MINSDSPNQIDTSAGVDTNRDGFADTVLLPDPDELALAVDLDRDGLADLLVHVDPDGVAYRTALDPAGVMHDDLAVGLLPLHPWSDCWPWGS
jgi:hypothetical protein